MVRKYVHYASAHTLINGNVASPFTWNEEWQLTRLEDSEEGEDEKDGVWILTCTEARRVEESVTECVHTVLANALRKFTQHWADLHVLVLDKSTYAPNQFVIEAIALLEPEEIKHVDSIFLIDNGKVVQCHPIAGP